MRLASKPPEPGLALGVCGDQIPLSGCYLIEYRHLEPLTDIDTLVEIIDLVGHLTDDLVEGDYPEDPAREESCYEHDEPRDEPDEDPIEVGGKFSHNGHSGQWAGERR